MSFNLQAARVAIARGEFQSVEASLREYLAANPDDPVANLAAAELELCTQREPDAIRRLPFIQPGTDRDLIGQSLANFLSCRGQLAARCGVETDELGAELSAALNSAGNWNAHKGVGIEVSACIIVRDESAHLAECLESIRGFVDEVIVVDTGSVDNTIEIARGAGAKVLQTEWTNDFSSARNVALDAATKPWILWIDADERLTPESLTFWREGIMRPHFGGFMVRIVNFIESNGERTEFVHTPVRLFKNHAEIRFQGKIHEQIAPSILARGERIAALTGVVLNHYGYLPNAMQSKDKINRTLAMLRAELEADPENAFHLFNLAMTHSVAGDYRETERAAKKCIKHLEPESLIGANAYHLWVLGLLNQGRYAEAVRAAEQAESDGYATVLSEYEKGQALLALNKTEPALETAKKCVEMPWPERLTGDTSVASSRRHLLLGRVYLAANRPQDAFSAISQSAECVDRTGLLGSALLQAGEFKGAISFFEQLYEVPSSCMTAKLLAAKAWLELGVPTSTLELVKDRWEQGARDEDGFTLWVLAAENLGESEEILTAYRHFTEACAPTEETLTNWGRAFAQSGNVDGAMECFAEASKLDPKSANALLNAGDVQFSVENYLEAAHFYEQALRINSENAQAWFVLGNCLMHMAALDGAEAAYHQCLRLDANHESALSNLALLGEVRAGTLAA